MKYLKNRFNKRGKIGTVPCILIRKIAARRERRRCVVMDKKYSVAGLFGGVGGIEMGFSQAGFNISWANEIDHKASTTYRLNHTHELVVEDINNVATKDIPEVDVLVGGFPCQAFSVAGYRKGFEDDRGNVFFQIIRIVKEKLPRVIFLENVKNLVSHDNGNTFNVILDSLHAYGYKVKHKVLNASEYGNIPQNRERIYIVAFLEADDFKNFDFPDPIPLQKNLSEFIDFNGKVDDRYYYTSEKQSFYNELETEITKTDTVYQWRRRYVRENKSGVCPTLTANMGTGGHNVPLILSQHGIRKLTPKECFKLQGFSEDFLLPSDLAQSHLYKQAGNSVVVPVVRRVASNIYDALKQNSVPYTQLQINV